MTESELASCIVTIQVTEEDIRKGSRGYSFCCPVAIAINRHLRGATASVGIDSIKLWTSSISFLRRKRPDSVKEFILRFDRYGPEEVRPFSFTLELPEWILRAEDQEQNPR